MIVRCSLNSYTVIDAYGIHLKTLVIFNLTHEHNRYMSVGVHVHWKRCGMVGYFTEKYYPGDIFKFEGNYKNGKANGYGFEIFWK